MQSVPCGTHPKIPLAILKHRLDFVTGNSGRVIWVVQKLFKGIGRGIIPVQSSFPIEVPGHPGGYP